MREFKNIVVTGGAGFIGSHLVRSLVNNFPDSNIINIDKLTYAGNLENLSDIKEADNYTFYKGDITDFVAMEAIFKAHDVNLVINLAAESHVDRSIEDPGIFLQTNIIGTNNLLRLCKEQDNDIVFYHVSTDEVYGSLGATGLFTENTPYDPRSPYSASKASSDHLVRAYHHTYGLDVLISNCSNNYGPNQFPEKLIPLVINNFKLNKPIPVYGDGLNVRDWLYVEDHVSAILAIAFSGKFGETYNIGGNAESTNINIVRQIGEIIDTKLDRTYYNYDEYITFVKDRPGHDRRYAIDSTKISTELKWSPKVNLKEGLEKTITWYLENEEWMNNVTSGEYKSYYQKQYQ